MRTLILTLLAAHLPIPPTSQPNELAKLNECIQQRFQDRKSFGMSRILPDQFHGVRQFRAENSTEQAVIANLEGRGYSVALYLAGRAVMSDASFQIRYGVQGPAYITRLRDPKELPDPKELLADSRAAFVAFQTGEVYDIRKGDWKVAMRPLRASNEACVTCHNLRVANVRLNEALGVAMYVYKRN